MTLWKTSDGVSLDTLAEEATVADLVEALKGIGEVRRAEEGYKLSTLQGVSVPKPGRYLVVRLEDAE